MARPISASHDLRRDEILNVAAACFAGQSYPATSMNHIAAACGTSKARLYHYYESKEAILFDLLDRYTQKLLLIIGQVEATAQRRALDERASLHELIRAFLREYETSATRHAALLACECDARGRLGMEEDAYPQRQHLLAALAAAQGLDTASVAQAALAQGARGEAIGKAVARARAEAVQAWLQGGPAAT